MVTWDFAASGHLPPLVNEVGSSLGHLPNCCVEGIKTVLGFSISSSSLPTSHLGRDIRCEICCTPAHHRPVLETSPSKVKHSKWIQLTHKGDGHSQGGDVAESHATSVTQWLSTPHALEEKPSRVVEGVLSSPLPGLCILLLTLCLSEYSPFCTSYACCSPRVVWRYASLRGTCLTSKQPAMVQGRKEAVEELFCRHMVPNISFLCLLPLPPPFLLCSKSSSHA